MKILFLLSLLYYSVFASLDFLTTFEADFKQTIKDNKDKILSYEGHLIAAKPQNALWKYETPIQKHVYLLNNHVTIIEPEIEQVIIKKVRSSLDFFQILHHAKQKDAEHYLAHFEGNEYTFEVKEKLLKAISYKDEFDNLVRIEFSNQKQNNVIDDRLFRANIPDNFDIIEE